MEYMNVLAVEVGQSSVKAVVVDTAAAAIGAIAEANYEVAAPAPEAAEVPAEQLWRTVASTARAAVRQAQIAGTANDVGGIALTVVTPALVLAGADEQAMAPIWTCTDRRARPVARQVWAAVGPEFLATTRSEERRLGNAARMEVAQDHETE